MRLHVSHDVVADQVWRAMSALVLDNKDAWRRAAVESTGLPFSRIRIVKRLSRGPMTVKGSRRDGDDRCPSRDGGGPTTSGARACDPRDKPVESAVQVGLADSSGARSRRRPQQARRPAAAGVSRPEDADLEALRAILDRIPASRAGPSVAGGLFRGGRTLHGGRTLPRRADSRSRPALSDTLFFLGASRRGNDAAGGEIRSRRHGVTLRGLSPTVTPRMEKVGSPPWRCGRRTDSRNRLTRMAIADLSL